MCSVFRSASLAVLLSFALYGAAPAGTILRVCADPNNLPFSNQRQQGLENALASLIAENLGATLQYTWWAERKSFLKSSLGAGNCDAVMGVPEAMEDVAVTRPYYRSTYVIVTRQDQHLDIQSLLDPALEHCRIGIHIVGDGYAPPAELLSRRGFSANIRGYSLFAADGTPDPPSRLIEAVRSGEVDAAVVWGPFAGYFAQTGRVPLKIAPVQPAMFMGTPFTYGIAVAVRSNDAALRDRIDAVLLRRRAEVQQLLRKYGIPLVGDGDPREGER